MAQTALDPRRFARSIAGLAFSLLMAAGASAAPPDSKPLPSKSQSLPAAAKTNARAAKAKPAGRDAQNVNPAERQAIDQVADAYSQGRPMAVILALSPLWTRFEGDRLIVLDEELKARNLPPAGELAGEARMTLAIAASNQQTPRPGAHEAVIVLQYLGQQFDNMVADVEGHAIMADPLIAPSDLEAFEKLLWGGHVMHNRLLGARRIAEYAGAFSASAAKRNGQSLASRNYQDLARRVERLERDLHERGIELRMLRLSVARQQLEKPELTPERLMAAYDWNVDARLIDEFYRESQQQRRPPMREKLKDEAFKAQAAGEAAKAKELAGDLTAKATWLAEGMHWWYRGRYGAGPELWGLAKSQESLASPQTMFPLYMPTEPPTPVDPFRRGDKAEYENQVKYPERRHYYWWALEDRGVQTRSSGPFVSQTSHTERTPWVPTGRAHSFY